MQPPLFLQEKIASLYSEIKSGKLKQTQKNLTQKYKTESGESKSLIEDKNDSVLYAISRMPATYSVTATLLAQLTKQNLIQKFDSVIDVGSGTGAGYFAVNSLFENVSISLFERDENMIAVFGALTDNLVQVSQTDIINDNINAKADLVMTSYVLSEMTEQDRLNSVLKLLDMSQKYLLIIDTGTPRVYENMMKIKKHVQEKGYHIIAPCMSEKCGLKNDYCQFFARVERSSLMRRAKSGELSYEDEKYFYLLISKEITENLNKINQKCEKRIIRRPIIKPNNIELALCTKNGVTHEIFTKKNKEMFKIAKKSKINDCLPEN